VTIVDAESGEPAEPIIVDRATLRPIREPEFAWVPGPAAGERTRRRYALRRQGREAAKEAAEGAAKPGAAAKPTLAQKGRAT